MPDLSWLGAACDVRPLFGRQHAALICLLHELTEDDWQQATACPGRDVKDSAAHLLGGHLGRLSTSRDGWHALQPRPHESTPAFVERINDEWVTAARRLSPPLLVHLLDVAGTQVVAFWRTANMGGLGPPVSWAGADPAPVWLHAARDFAEQWTHHQQICEATGRPGLIGPDFLGPVIDTFLRALPHTLRDVDAPAGTNVEVTVTGPAGGIWTCTRRDGRWRLLRQAHPRPDARLSLDADTAWRLCTRHITPEQADAHARRDGDPRLTTAALTITAITRSHSHVPEKTR